MYFSHEQRVARVIGCHGLPGVTGSDADDVAEHSGLPCKELICVAL